MARKTHKDVEFAVDDNDMYRSFDEAAGAAVSLAASTGRDVDIDVLIYSKAGARWWGGDDAVDMHEEDPDSSVSDRIVVSAESVGRIA